MSMILEDENTEGTDGLQDLVDEGAKPDEPKPDDDEGEGGDEEGDEGGEGGDEGDDSGVSERLSALESKLDEKDAEITFLRGEVAKRRETGATPKAPAGDTEYNLDEIAAKLTDKDPKTAAKAIVDIAKDIASKELAKLRDETTTILSSNEQIRVAKETDRQNVLGEFGEYLDDKDFVGAMTEIFNSTARAAGGKYVPDSLYLAAAAASRMIDKKRAAKTNGKNGVTPRKPAAPANPVDGDAHDYSKVKTIAGIPDSMLPARDKIAAKGVVRKMGITEKEWVENFFLQAAEEK